MYPIGDWKFYAETKLTLRLVHCEEETYVAVYINTKQSLTGVNFHITYGGLCLVKERCVTINYQLRLNSGSNEEPSPEFIPVTLSWSLLHLPLISSPNISLPQQLSILQEMQFEMPGGMEQSLMTSRAQ